MKKIIGVIGIMVICFAISMLFIGKLDFKKLDFKSFEIWGVRISESIGEDKVIYLSKEQSKDIRDIIFSQEYKRVKDEGFKHYDKLLIFQIRGIEDYEEFQGEIIISNINEQGIELNYTVNGYKSKNNGHYRIIDSGENLYEKIWELIA